MSFIPHAMITTAHVLGASSLLLLLVLFVRGPVQLIDLGLSAGAALLLDGLLCLAFFVQHSVMVRRSFRRRLATLVPEHYHGAVYTIASGLVLLLLLVLWQPIGIVLASAAGPLHWLLHGCAAAAILGFVWGGRALGPFDAFGIQPIKAHLSGTKPHEQPLTIRGPYRWVRHPLYTSILVLLWCFPHLTADRLLLNLSWTIWVVIGTILEERDLVAAFGDQYRKYQRTVPMLLPYRAPRIIDEST